jgi:hypothetical protein
MLSLRWIVASILLLASPLLVHAQEKDADSKGWLKLFDGKTSFGWIDEGKSLSVQDGIMVLKGGKATFSFPFPALELEGEVQTTEPGKGVEVRCGEKVHAATLQAGADFSSIRMHVKAPANPQAKDSGCWVDLKVSPGQTLRIRSLKVRPLGLQSIFNGKDLAGWKVFPGKKSTFEVESGILRVKDGPGDLQTEKKYGDFILQLECKTNGKHLNSGVFFRCRDGEYQNGYEAQIRNQFTQEATQDYVIDEYDPMTRKLLEKKKIKATAVDFGTGSIYRRVPARLGVAQDGEWFTMTVAAQGNHLATWVDGILVADWHDWRPLSDNARTGCRLEPGHISLQGHDPTTDLSFRNFRIAEYR